MPRLRFRLPGHARPVGSWLGFILPDLDRSTRRRLFEQQQIRVEGEPVDHGRAPCPAGASIEIDAVPDEWLAVPPAEPSSTWLAWVDEPAWLGGRLDLDPAASDRELDGSVDVAGEVDDGEEGGDEDDDGETRNARAFEFRVEARQRGLARLVLTGPATRAAEVCRALAEAGMPVVGDLLHGGLAAPGGAVIATTREACDARLSLEQAPWPEPPGVETAEGAEPARLRLRISREAARAVSRGHPWILPDPASDRAGIFRPGTLVRVEDREAHALGWAWIEGDARVAARMAAWGDVERRAIDSVEARVARALARRRRLLFEAVPERPTDCFRLIHGEADALPGLFVDRLGPLLRVLVTGRASEGFRDRAVAALRAQLPTTPEGAPWSILELLHLRAPGRPGRFDRVRWIVGGPDALAATGAEPVGAGLWVRERGLRFHVDPGWDRPRKVRPGFGLFPDQRENRARLDPLAARGGRWLNLFAHTGAFSVSLLAAGAESVVSVDLSAPYLARLDANLEANRERGVDPARHESVRGEGRRTLESLDPGQRFAGIVLDPPTAAAAGRRFWSVRQDLEPMLRLCVERLDEGGALLVTQNRKGPPLALDSVLERVAARAGRRIGRLQPAPPGIDHPSLAGFAEGEAFEGWLLILDA